LVTGDLVQDDSAGYLRFRSIFGNLEKPVLCIPGNHDEPEAMRRELNCLPFQICGTHEAEGWQFIMLDSYDPGHVGGRLTPACIITRYSWAAAGWTPWGWSTRRPFGG